MPSLRELVVGPWRAVAVLGVTQILAWGAVFYPPVMTVPLIAAERGFSFTFAMGGFSAGLLAAGFVSPSVGSLIDRYGGHRVMPVGSLAGAAGLVALTYATHPAAYFAVWGLLGVAMAASLYDPAFATLGRIFGAKARQPITVLTLAGGFASTVSWPATYALLQPLGWQGTYLVYAALLAFVAAPLHAFALPRTRAAHDLVPSLGAAAPARVRPAAGTVFGLLVAAFAAYSFIPSGLSAHLLAIFQRAGIEPATVVLIGALFGPSQVAARLCEFIFARNVHPLVMVRFAVSLLLLSFVLLWLFGFSTAAAIAFAIMFGVANGLCTIARGAVPLALFGPAGYGLTIGRIARPALVITAVAPVVIAFVAERASDPVALGVAAAFAVVSLVCFTLVRR
ncbi:MAG: MFS transporter [Alphaproteobacteria bacterium]|nr:MAG: MFS transporter [Alphaproteobacteria bacterium]